MGRKQRAEDVAPDYLQNILKRHYQIISFKNANSKNSKNGTLVYDSSKEIRSPDAPPRIVLPAWVKGAEEQDETKKFQKNIVFNPHNTILTRYGLKVNETQNKSEEIEIKSAKESPEEVKKNAEESKKVELPVKEEKKSKSFYKSLVEVKKKKIKTFLKS